MAMLNFPRLFVVFHWLHFYRFYRRFCSHFLFTEKSLPVHLVTPAPFLLYLLLYCYDPCTVWPLFIFPLGCLKLCPLATTWHIPGVQIFKFVGLCCHLPRCYMSPMISGYLPFWNSDLMAGKVEWSSKMGLMGVYIVAVSKFLFLFVRRWQSYFRAQLNPDELVVHKLIMHFRAQIDIDKR